MAEIPRLLVVDDEASICQACRRIFSGQGFQVEESTNAREGLNQATENDYAGILLDIKMPHMDGIQFLEQLRKKKPDIPVLIMTGYPSVPNAAAAVRLGASDYVTKPFTPEEITQSVRRMIRRESDEAGRREAVSPGVQPDAETPAPAEVLFRDESWVRLEEDGSACVGAVLACPKGAAVRAVRLPRIGEVVYQGLPLAGVSFDEETSVTVPAPVSGVVVAVNELLSKEPSALLGAPCGQGWIACICTTRLEEEMKTCAPRRVILAKGVEPSGRIEREQLASWGCRVRVARDWEELAPAVEDPDYRVLVLDAASFGREGPELAGRIRTAAPATKVLVFAPSDSPWEAAYREQNVFSHVAEPFTDAEVVRILDAAFRPQAAVRATAERRRAPSASVGSINITNRNRTKVRLLAEPGLLEREYGIGWKIRQKLTRRMLPVVTTPGVATLTPTDIVNAAGTCDRLMVLTAKDLGRLPGSLARDTKAEFGSVAGRTTSRVTTLEVQPDTIGGGFAGFDERTSEALAEQLVQEMASY